jgi:hypothetical protein
MIAVVVAGSMAQVQRPRFRPHPARHSIGHAASLLVAAYLTRRGLNGMAQPDHTAFERLAAGQSKCLIRAWAFIGGTVIIDNALNASHAIDGWIDQCTEHIDQPLFQERAVDRAAAFEQQGLRTEDTCHCAKASARSSPPGPAKT